LVAVIHRRTSTLPSIFTRPNTPSSNPSNPEKIGAGATSTRWRCEIAERPSSKLSPEIERLAFLIGTWNAADTYEKSSFAPNGGSGSGVYETIPGPGGFSLLTDYHYRGPHGESSGHQVLTWDSKEEQYMGYMVTSNSPASIVVAGNWDGPNLVLTGEFEPQGMKVRFKSVFSNIEERTMVLRQYNSVNGAPTQLFGTTQFTRQ
jgi:hypothetical protein